MSVGNGADQGAVMLHSSSIKREEQERESLRRSLSDKRRCFMVDSSHGTNGSNVANCSNHTKYRSTGGHGIAP